MIFLNPGIIIVITIMIIANPTAEPTMINAMIHPCSGRFSPQFVCSIITNRDVVFSSLLKRVHFGWLM